MVFKPNSDNANNVTGAIEKFFKTKKINATKEEYDGYIFYVRSNDDKRVIIFIHVADIFLVKVSTIEYETNFLISIFDNLVNHKSKLGNVSNRAGILFIEQWHTIRLVHRNGKIKYRQPFVIFFFAKFIDIYVVGITVFVCRVIGDVNSACLVELTCRVHVNAN